MTIFIKFVDDKYAGAFRNADAVDKDRMKYQIMAKAYYDSMSSIIDCCITEAKNRIKTFADFLNKAKVSTHNHFLLESDIKKARQDLEKYEVLKIDMDIVDTPLDYCKFYCKYHGIEYRPVSVKE